MIRISFVAPGGLGTLSAKELAKPNSFLSNILRSDRAGMALHAHIVKHEELHGEMTREEKYECASFIARRLDLSRDEVACGYWRGYNKNLFPDDYMEYIPESIEPLEE